MVVGGMGGAGRGQPIRGKETNQDLVYIRAWAAVVRRQRVKGQGAAVLRTRPLRMPPPSGAKLLGQPDPLISVPSNGFEMGYPRHELLHNRA